MRKKLRGEEWDNFLPTEHFMRIIAIKRAFFSAALLTSKRTDLHSSGALIQSKRNLRCRALSKIHGQRQIAQCSRLKKMKAEKKRNENFIKNAFEVVGGVLI